MLHHDTTLALVRYARGSPTDVAHKHRRSTIFEFANRLQEARNASVIRES